VICIHPAHFDGVSTITAEPVSHRENAVIVVTDFGV
jgi:hypothetical protein